MSSTTTCVIPTHSVVEVVDSKCIALSAAHWVAESQGAEYSGPAPSPTATKNPTPIKLVDRASRLRATSLAFITTMER